MAKRRFSPHSKRLGRKEDEMHAPQLTAVLAASATWIGFASTMKTYFRHAERRTPAKTGLIVSGLACTVIQIAVLAGVKQPGAAWSWLGVGLYAAANGLFWWALTAHGKSHPAFAFIRVPPATLTTAGPYRLVRHPIYTAYLLAWCAGAVAAAQPWLLLAVGCMAIIYGSAAWQEEQAFLGSKFAGAYREYRGRSGMFLPKVAALVTLR
jgi:protein-S-isoprenylcysteine O-methyltransferase Ste14